MNLNTTKGRKPFKLVNPSPFATKTFRMVHIHTLFSIFATEAEAIAACD